MIELSGIVLANSTGGAAAPRFSRSRTPELVCVANEPILSRALTSLSQLGVEKVVLVVHPQWGEEIREAVGDGSAWSLSVSYLARPPLGPADGIRAASEMLGPGPVIAYPGNGVSFGDLQERADRFRGRRLAASVPAPGPGHVEAGGEGVWLLDDAARTLLRRVVPSWRGYLELWDLARMLRLAGRLVELHVDRWWSYHGLASELLEGNRLLLDRLVGHWSEADVRDSMIEGRVSISAAAKVESSLIRGPAVVGPGAELLDAYVGPYTSIGPGAVVCGVEVENSVIMSGAVLADIASRIEDSVVGESTTFNQNFPVRRTLELKLAHGTTATAG